MKNITIIGAGTMGNGIAHAFAQSGYLVNLVDISADSLDRAIAIITKNLDRLLSKEKISEEDKNNTLSNISTNTDLTDAVKDADLVVLHTEWNDFKSINFKKLSPSKNLKIYDLRNIFSPHKIESQGFKYFGIGR